MNGTTLHSGISRDQVLITQLMHSIIECDEQSTKSLIIKKEELEIKDDTGATALIWGAIKGKKKGVELLIKEGAHINAENSKGETALFFAVLEGHSEIVKLLIGNKAEVNRPDVSFALNYALNKGNYEIADELIRAGSIDAKNKEGNTPLILASASGNEKQVHFLLERKAQIECTDNAGNTALICSVFFERWQSTKLLIAAKANVIDAKTNAGETALLIAAHKGNTNIVRNLLAAGADIKTRSNNGSTPLITALGSEDIKTNTSRKKVVKYLLNKGASVNVQNQDGSTPLILAVRWGESSLITTLIVNGALIDSQEKLQGLTALHLAVYYGHDEIFNLLLQNGANPHIPTHDGISVCDFAFFHKREDIIDLLLLYGWLSPVEQGFGINKEADSLILSEARRKTEKEDQRRQKDEAHAQLVERIKYHRIQVIEDQRQKEEERLKRIAEDQERQRKRLIVKANKNYASPVEFSASESILSTTAECRDSARKKMTEEEEKKAAKLNKKPAPISEEKKAELDEQKIKEEKNQELESIQRQFFLKPAVYAIYQRLFKKEGPIKLVEILQLLKALQGIEIPNESQEGEEIRLIDVSEKTRGSHVNIKMSLNPQLRTGSEPADSVRFVFLRSCENLKNYSIDQACKKLTDLGFGLDNIREEEPENVLA